MRERREVVSEWTDASVVPVDQADMRAPAALPNRDIFEPHVAVEEGLWPSEMSDRLGALVLLLSQRPQALEQPVSHRDPAVRAVAVRFRQRVEARDRVSDARAVEAWSELASQVARLS